MITSNDQNKTSAAALYDWLVHPPVNGPPITLLVRLMAGGVFFWEGLLKFVYVNQGVGRFTKLGMPLPDVLAHAIAVLEIGGGLLVMSGLFTRLISIPFICEMIVAILSTKISLYLGTSPLPAPPAPPKAGVWAVLHEIRSDYAQIMTCIFLLVAGPGPWSLDALLSRRRTRADGATSDQPGHTRGWMDTLERRPQ
jgi:putative oxidoreductase